MAINCHDKDNNKNNFLKSFQYGISTHFCFCKIQIITMTRPLITQFCYIVKNVIITNHKNYNIQSLNKNKRSLNFSNDIFSTLKYVLLQ